MSVLLRRCTVRHLYYRQKKIGMSAQNLVICRDALVCISELRIVMPPVVLLLVMPVGLNR